MASSFSELKGSCLFDTSMPKTSVTAIQRVHEVPTDNFGQSYKRVVPPMRSYVVLVLNVFSLI